jgi:hypothetical protein
MFCVCLDFKWCFVIAFISNAILWLSLFQVMFCDCLYFKWYFVIIFISNDVLLFYVFVALYTQSPVLMLQYHILPTKHSTVPVFIRYVLLCVRCILHTITCTNVTISLINNQKFYRSHVYTVCSFICLLYFTHNHLY